MRECKWRGRFPETWRQVGSLSKRFRARLGADFDALSVLSASLESGHCGGFAEALGTLAHCARARRHVARLTVPLAVEAHAYPMSLVGLDGASVPPRPTRPRDGEREWCRFWGGFPLILSVRRLADVLEGCPTGTPPLVVIDQVRTCDDKFGGSYG